jgi:hypothetical protein
LSLVPPCQSSEDFVIEQGICYTEVHPRTLPLSPPQHSNKLFFTPLLQRRYCQRKIGLWVPHSCSTPSLSRIDCTFSYTSSIKINIATRLTSSMVIIFLPTHLSHWLRIITNVGIYAASSPPRAAGSSTSASSSTTPTLEHCTSTTPSAAGSSSAAAL